MAKRGRKGIVAKQHTTDTHAQSGQKTSSTESSVPHADSSDDCIEITSEDVPKNKDVNVKAKTAPLGCQTSRQKLKNSKPRIISKVSPLKSPPRDTSESGTLILVNNSPNTVTQSDCANELTPIESTSNTDCQNQPNVPEKKSTRSPRKQTLVVRKEAQEKQILLLDDTKEKKASKRKRSSTTNVRKRRKCSLTVKMKSFEKTPKKNFPEKGDIQNIPLAVTPTREAKEKTLATADEATVGIIGSTDSNMDWVISPNKHTAVKVSAAPVASANQYSNKSPKMPSCTTTWSPPIESPKLINKSSSLSTKSEAYCKKIKGKRKLSGHRRSHDPSKKLHLPGSHKHTAYDSTSSEDELSNNYPHTSDHLDNSYNACDSDTSSSSYSSCSSSSDALSYVSNCSEATSDSSQVITNSDITKEDHDFSLCIDEDLKVSSDPPASGTDSEDTASDNIDTDLENDDSLEQKANEVNLTDNKVKMLIKNVLNNDLVKDYVRLVASKNDVTEENPDFFESVNSIAPMTRSRIKQVIDKEGEIPNTLWPMSPIKILTEKTLKEASPTPQFLDLHFSDEEDGDDEYNPQQQEEIESDLDSESMLSSHFSDMGSPVCSLPVTPASSVFSPSNSLLIANSSPITPVSSLSHDVDRASTPTGRRVDHQKHSMGPPRPLRQQAVQNLSTKLNDSMLTEPTIATRTRSKLPITDEDIDEIASNFVAPDFSPDLYYTDYATDASWSDFLTALNKDNYGSQVNETGEDDPTEDPEYNFIKEIEEEPIDHEERRDDKAVNITKKELNSLMDELFEAYGGADLLSDTEDASQVSLPSPPKNREEKEDSEETESTVEHQLEILDPSELKQPLLHHMKLYKEIKAKDVEKLKEVALEEPINEQYNQEIIALQLQDQMRKHTQLLLQLYVMANDRPKYEEVTITSRLYLEELMSFSQQFHDPTKSYFHACNLPEAISIINTPLPKPNVEHNNLVISTYKKKNYSSSHYRDNACLSFEQMNLLVNTPACIFPQLLPEVNFRNKLRVMFYEGEDNLLAMGVAQFKGFFFRNHYIKRYMIPIKSPDQMSYRIKRLSSIYGYPNNAMKFLRQEGHLPEFPRFTEVEPVHEIVPPIERDVDMLPLWYPIYETVKQVIDQDIKSEIDNSNADRSKTRKRTSNSSRKTSTKPLKRTASEKSNKEKMGKKTGRQPLRRKDVNCTYNEEDNSDDSCIWQGDGTMDDKPTAQKNRKLLDPKQEPLSACVITDSSKLFDYCAEQLSVCSDSASVVSESSGSMVGVEISDIADNVTIKDIVSDGTKQRSKVDDWNVSSAPESVEIPKPKPKAKRIRKPYTNEMRKAYVSSRKPTTFDPAAQNVRQPVVSSSMTFPVLQPFGTVPQSANVIQVVQMPSNNAGPSVIVVQPNNMQPTVIQYSNNIVQQNVPKKPKAIAPKVSTQVRDKTTHPHQVQELAQSPQNVSTLYQEATHPVVPQTEEPETITVSVNVPQGESSTMVQQDMAPQPSVSFDDMPQNLDMPENIFQPSPPQSSPSDLATHDIPCNTVADTSKLSATLPVGKVPVQSPQTFIPIDHHNAAIANSNFRVSPNIIQTCHIQSPGAKSPLTHISNVPSPLANSPCTSSPLPHSPMVQSPLVESTFAQSPLVESTFVQSPLVESTFVQSPRVQVTEASQANNTDSDTIKAGQHVVHGSESPMYTVSPSKCNGNLLQQAMLLSDIHDDGCITCDGEPSEITVNVPTKKASSHIVILGDDLGRTKHPLTDINNMQKQERASRKAAEITQPLQCHETMSPVQNIASPNFNPITNFHAPPSSPAFQSISSPSTVMPGSPNFQVDRYSNVRSTAMSSQLKGNSDEIENTSTKETIKVMEPITQSPIVPENLNKSDAHSQQDSLFPEGGDQISNTTIPDGLPANRTAGSLNSFHNTSFNSSICSNATHSDLLNYSGDFNESVELSLEVDSDVSPGPSPEKDSRLLGPLVTPQKVFDENFDENSLSPSFSRTPSSRRNGMSATSTPKSSTLNSKDKSNSTHAVQIMADIAKQIVSPPKRNFRIYRRGTPSPKKRLSQPIAIAPKSFTSPVKVNSPFKKESPRRQLLRSRAILPKTLLNLSPLQRTADGLVKRSAAVSRRILSKSPNKNTTNKTAANNEIIESLKKEKIESKKKKPKNVVRKILPAPELGFHIDTEMPDIQPLQDNLSDGNQSADEKENNVAVESRKKTKPVIRRRTRKQAEIKKVDIDLESVPEGVGAVDSKQDSESHLADLMAACSTVRFSGREHPEVSEKQTTKATRKRDMLVDMLSGDLLGSDPMRDERDTMLAQAYLTNVRKALIKEPQKYQRFLRLLCDFTNSNDTPVELYHEITGLLSDFPELQDDFSSFLLPYQAIQCGVYMSHKEFTQARTFLSKIEKFFKKHPSYIQKIVRILSEWWANPAHDPDTLQSAITPLLKGEQHLVDEFSLFFPKAKPPNSMMTDFEEVTLLSEETNDKSGRAQSGLTGVKTDGMFDGYEEVTLAKEKHGTAERCACKCHLVSGRKERKKTHCNQCGLRVVNGQLYLQVTNKVLRPMTLYYDGKPAVLKSQKEKQEVAEPVEKVTEGTEAEIVELLSDEDLDHVSEIDEEELERLLQDDPEKNPPKTKALLDSDSDADVNTEKPTKDKRKGRRKTSVAGQQHLQWQIQQVRGRLAKRGIYLDDETSGFSNTVPPPGGKSAKQSSKTEKGKSTIRTTKTTKSTAMKSGNTKSTTTKVAKAAKPETKRTKAVSTKSTLSKSGINKSSTVNPRGQRAKNVAAQSEIHKAMDSESISTAKAIRPVANAAETSGTSVITGKSVPAVVRDGKSNGKTDGKSDGVNPTSTDTDHADRPWTMEEDRILLQLCRDQSACPQTYASIHEQLTTRSIKHIEQRYDQLLAILSQSSDEEDET